MCRAGEEVNSGTRSYRLPIFPGLSVTDTESAHADQAVFFLIPDIVCLLEILENFWPTNRLMLCVESTADFLFLIFLCLLSLPWDLKKDLGLIIGSVCHLIYRGQHSLNNRYFKMLVE